MDESVVERSEDVGCGKDILVVADSWAEMDGAGVLFDYLFAWRHIWWWCERASKAHTTENYMD